ncbi:AarF/ABC1/UbiB kinase family protein [Candidatus Woesearchaeota archaeon]|nr:AarF/ABC1/UbiB kinase family protein [Candidatus Woesearchaeota archaeon]
MNIKKEVRDIRRLQDILLVLVESGFGYLISKIKLSSLVPFGKRVKAKLKPKKKITNPERLRLTFEKLGPTFIKFGQLLSLRPDLLPKEYIRELGKLQDRVPPFSSTEAKKIVEHELGPISKPFSKFEPKPVASASISQVHKAVLKNKKTVAVKIRRPGVRSIMETDIEIMMQIAKLIEKYIPRLRRYNPIAIVNEFHEWTKRELDLRKEARNAQRFYNNFKGSKSVYIPKVYKELCTKKVFVSEFIEAIELHDVKDVKRKGLNLSKIIKNGYMALLTQVFEHGFFHADPHPGNILIMKDNRIAFVDYGIVGYFDDKLKEKSIDIIYGIVKDEPERVVSALLELGSVGKEGVDIDSFEREVQDAIEELQGASLSDVKLSLVLEEVLDIALKYRVKMPLDFILFGKTIVTLEGVALEYDPEFKIIDTTKPFVERLMLKEKPKYFVKDLISRTTKLKDSIVSFPTQTYSVLKKLQKGTIRFGIEDREIRRLGVEIDKSSDRLVYGIVIAALIIASAWTVNIPGGPRIWDIHFLPFSFLVFALIVSILLLISIHKEKEIE